jgi:RHS repeat-associated protein
VPVLASYRYYDAQDRLTGITDLGPNTATLQYDYAYDQVGNLIAEFDNGVRTTYGYFPDNELQSVNGVAQALDATGNRTGTGISVGADNQVTSEGGWTYSYDPTGNETGKTNSTTGESWSYGYDDKNELIQAVDTTSTGTTTYAYKYDPFGSRIEQDVTTSAGTAVTKYVLDGWNPATADATGNAGWDVWADLDGSGNLQTTYLRGDVVDQLFARESTGGSSAFLLSDHLGSIVGVTDLSGNLLDQISYDAFGNITNQQYASGATAGVAGHYLYTARELDATGLQYSRARYYDSTTGRWLSQDPLGFDAGDSNLYRYVKNAPTDATDPSGLSSWTYGTRTVFVGNGYKTVRTIEYVPDPVWIPAFGYAGSTTPVYVGDVNGKWVTRTVYSKTGAPQKYGVHLDDVAKACSGNWGGMPNWNTWFPANVPTGMDPKVLAGYTPPAPAAMKETTYSVPTLGGSVVAHGQDYARTFDKIVAGLEGVANSVGKMVVEGIEATTEQGYAIGSDLAQGHFLDAKQKLDVFTLGAIYAGIHHIAAGVRPNDIPGYAQFRSTDPASFDRGLKAGPLYTEIVLFAATEGFSQAARGGAVVRAAAGEARAARQLEEALAAARADGTIARLEGRLGEAAGRLRSLDVISNTCFTAGTPLLTPTGDRAVEHFQVGDPILSRPENEPEGEVEVRFVERVFVREALIMELQVEGRRIRTTEGHPFYVRGRGWISAKELKPGDYLSSHDGQWVTVEAVTDLNEVAMVYNLRVSEFHTYFVGSQEWGFSVWAHNANYAVLPHPGGGFALAQRLENGTFRWVTEHGTSNIRAFASEAAAVEAITSGGGTRFAINATTWQQYEGGIRSLYGEATFGQRQFSVLVDGVRVNGVADNVVEIAGRRIAVEAKFTENWANSLRNPASSIGNAPFAVEEQARMLSQARAYSAAFDEVIYHSNSSELIAHYTRVFRGAGITNFRFVLTP